MFLLKDTCQIGQKKFLLVVKLKILYHVINDLNGEKITGTFHEKKMQETNQQE